MDSARERVQRNEELGRLAAMAGDPDFKEQNDPRTSLVDTLANLRHWARSAGLSWYAVLAEAEAHYAVEISEAAAERREETRNGDS